MGDVNRAFGGGSELEFEGKKYTLSPWTYKIQGAYERHLENEAFKALKKIKHLLPPDDYQEQLRRYQQDVAIGVYSFGSDYVYKSWQYLPNFKQLVFLMIQPNHPEVTKEFVDQMIDKQYEEIVMKVGEANADPTSSERTQTES